MPAKYSRWIAHLVFTSVDFLNFFLLHPYLHQHIYKGKKKGKLVIIRDNTLRHCRCFGLLLSASFKINLKEFLFNVERTGTKREPSTFKDILESITVLDYKMEHPFWAFPFFFFCFGGCRTTLIAASKTDFTFCTPNKINNQIIYH